MVIVFKLQYTRTILHVKKPTSRCRYYYISRATEVVARQGKRGDIGSLDGIGKCACHIEGR